MVVCENGRNGSGRQTEIIYKSQRMVAYVGR